MGQGEVLKLIEKADKPISVSEIDEMMVLGRGSISRAVRCLKKQKLIKHKIKKIWRKQIPYYYI